MNWVDKFIISILLKICYILSHYSENDKVSTYVYMIQKEFNEI